MANDAARLSALLATTFYQRLMDGTIETRDAFIRDETDKDPGITRSSIKYAITKLTLRNDEADAEVTYSYTGTYSVGGLPKPLHGVVHLTDEWIFGRDGTWKLRLSTIHDAIAYVDGKLIQNQREQLAPSKATIGELRTHALVIPTLDLDANPAQLTGIGTAIGDARIVAMGEGSHGTSEFFAFKNRLFKYLVEEKGFTVFAMEAYWGAGLSVDRYIKTGRGTAAQAVASLGFWTWDTPEIVNLVQWMRDYNAKPGTHPILSFVGIDMQNPMGAIGYLATYLREHDFTPTDAARTALKCSAEAAAKYDAKPAAGCRQAVVALGERLRALKYDADAEMARHSVATILQYLDWKSMPDDARLGARDRDMAANLEWLAANFYPRAKIAVWAHNYHVGTGLQDLGSRPMGAYLRSAFRQNYYAIGQTFGSGTVRAIVSGHGLQDVAVPPSPSDSIAALFGSLSAPTIFIDLRRLKAGSALSSFFSTARSIQEIGATMDPLHPAYEVAMVVPSFFDGLVYIPTSTAATDGSHYFEMRREMQSSDGRVWEVSGVGFDDVTTTVSTDTATIVNRDGLNSSPNQLSRRFDAGPNAGRTVLVTGEVRSNDLLGFVYPIVEAVGPTGSITSSSRGGPLGSIGVGTWTQFTLTLKLPPNTRFVDAGFWEEGLGTVEVRNLKVARVPS